jgi:hypothetical protein
MSDRFVVDEPIPKAIPRTSRPAPAAMTTGPVSRYRALTTVSATRTDRPQTRKTAPTRQVGSFSWASRNGLGTTTQNLEKTTQSL